MTACSATVEDGSLSLERSGCRMSVSGSSPGGLKAAPTILFRLCYAWKGLSACPVMPWCYSLVGAQGMVLDAVVDPNVLSYPVPSIMRERGTVVRRGGANPWTLGEAEPSPQGSGEAEPSPRGSGETEFIPWGSGEAESSP